MRIAVWIVFGVLALAWTGGAWLAAELTGWLGRTVATGQAADLGQAVAQWPIPAWVGAWIDPALIVWLQDGVLWAITAVSGAAPAIGSAIGWLVPVVWLVWALGTALLVVLAGGVHLLIGRTRARPA